MESRQLGRGFIVVFDFRFAGLLGDKFMSAYKTRE
jgi:hypothetical protein